MSVYIPCLNPDSPDDGSGFSVGAGTGTTFGESLGTNFGISFTHSDSPFTLTIGPLPPFLGIGINFQFWENVFGLGETRIHREKEAIQDINTQIFKFLNASYGVPITDGHALQFSSSGVQAQFARRPDIAALVPSFLLDAPTVANLVFATQNPSTGEEERIVNQFLANAAYNNWPVDATVQIWDGMVAATSPMCSTDPSRWMQNPYILKRSAELATLLQYVPLSALVNLATHHEIGDALAEHLILLWSAHPELVASIPHQEKYYWQYIYENGLELQDPYTDPLNQYMPLYSRTHIQELFAGVQVPLPQYPNFLWPQGVNPLAPGQQPQPVPAPQPAPAPVPQPPSPTPVPQPPSPVPAPQPAPTPVPQPTTPPPAPQPNVLEIPNQQDLDRACQIIKHLQAGQTLTLSDSQWLLTPIGARAYYLQQQNPLCYLVDTTGVTPQIPTPQPNCPTFPPQQPPPTQTPYPTPTPQPYPPAPGTQPPDLTPCPPTCQEQIDVLEQKIHECCNETSLYVVPQLQDLWKWITDLETRVPGPAPQLPNTPSDIPLPGGLPPPNVDFPPPDNPTIPTGTVVIPPAVIDCVSTLCDGDGTPVPDDPGSWLSWVLLRICQCVKSGVIKAKKLVLDACQFGQLAWGIMAECWLNANTPEDPTSIVIPDLLLSLYNIEDAMRGEMQGVDNRIFDYALFYSEPYVATGIYASAQFPLWPFSPPEASPDYIFVDTSGDNTISLPVEEIA